MLVGTDTETIERSVIELLENPNVYAEMAEAHNPYRDGDSCQQIIDFLKQTCRNFHLFGFKSIYDNYSHIAL